MDPDQFHIDGVRLVEVFFTTIVLGFFVERSLSILFESRFFINRFQGKSLKELIAFVFAAAICWHWEFDALSLLFNEERLNVYGEIITGAIVAGFAKVSQQFFHHVLGAASKAEVAKSTTARIDPSKTIREASQEEDEAKGGGPRRYKQ